MLKLSNNLKAAIIKMPPKASTKYKISTKK